MRRIFASVGLTLVGSLCALQGRAEEVRLDVTRDNWFSNVGPEADGNNGAAPRLKLKSNQEMSVIDVDPSRLRGRVIESAVLHVRSTGEPILRRVTVGSLGADWVEGTGTNYAPEKGSSSHYHRINPDVPWTAPGSDLCSVILGQGGTVWRMADASPPDAQGWQQIPVDPSVVSARVAGISHGFLLFDDTGSEWSRDGERFTVHHMPNRMIYSRDQNASHAPYLTVTLGPRDSEPPAAPAAVRADFGDLPAGETWVSWKTPADQGPAGTVGFLVEVNREAIPRYLIPIAGKPGEGVRMHLRDLGLAPGAEVVLTVRAVDGAGNVGRAGQARFRVSSRLARALPGSVPRLPEGGPSALPKLGDAEVAVVDELDKIQPVTGAFIPEQPGSYLSSNHVWNAARKQVTVAAARNEFVGFQIMIRGSIGKVEPSLSFDGSPGIVASFGRYQPVTSSRGPMPDPIVPLDYASEASHGLVVQSLYCELYVPHSASAKLHRGRLTLKSGGKTVVLELRLRVWDFTLPDFLSFLPDMNCYDLPGNERDYYRLAHRHRTVLNRVPYSQRGVVSDGCAPAWDGKKLDWSEWDRRFGPYFDGTAFADLPRRAVPLECFYLPIHENWPLPMERNYNGNYWADRAFPASYRATLVEVSRQFAEHVQARRWRETLFQFFLNGKLDFKHNGWSRGSSPWLLDEPANFQDYWALRYFGAAFHEGADQVKGPAKLVFRTDISRPQWQRNTLDGLLDYNVVGSAVRKYHRMVLDRKDAYGEIVVEYGSTNMVEDANVQPVAWSLDSWSLGLDGVLPWQTIGNSDSWKKADSLSLFYPGLGAREPIPSIRLKAYRRGQQDVEYLTLLSQVTAEPRWAVGQRVREALKLSGQRAGTGAAGEDAGVIRYDRLRPQELWALRVRVGEALSAAHPPAKRKLVDLRTPPRDVSRLTEGHARTNASASR